MSNATMDQARPIQRSATDRKLLGVCGGFAEQYGLDPLLVRITVAVLALFGGLGVLLYLIGAAWLPEPGRASEPISGGRVLLIIIAVAAALLILPARFVFGYGDGMMWFLVAAGLFVLLIMLVRRPAAMSSAAVASEPAVAPGMAPTVAAAPTLEDVGEYATTPYPPVAYPAQPYVPPPVYPAGPRPPKRRSYLGLITLCASLIWFGLAWALNAAELTAMPAVVIFAGSLAILGLGLIVGAWFGRARWLVLLALPLALVVWGLSAVPPQVHLGQAVNWAGDGIGETFFQPTAADPDEFSWGYGSAYLDVADWADYPGVSQVSASVGVGELVIWVPDDWNVVVNASVGYGSISDDGRSVIQGQGIGARIVHDADEAAADAPSLQIDATVDLGQIRVQTNSAGVPLPDIATPTVPTPLVPPLPPTPAPVTPITPDVLEEDAA